MNTNEDIEQFLENFWTAAPGKVSKVDGDHVDVILCVNNKLCNGMAVEIPELESVPLMRLGCSSFKINLSIKKGDPLLVIFMSADPFGWDTKREGEISEAHSVNRNALNHAVAIPMSKEKGSPKGTLDVSEDGTVTINGHLEIKP